MINDPRIQELQSLLPQCMVADWVRLGSRLVRLLRDSHHSAKHDEILQRLLIQARASVALRGHRAASVPKITYPPALPISQRKDEIIAAIRNNQAVVIAGETGSGKTTQIPKMCLEAGLGIEGKIGCTQPRRVAALSISQRISEELGVAWGEQVGCKIRFDDRSSQHTYIQLMTDGILLAETQGDRTLAAYNCLIIDEAHERSLNIDFLLGYLKLLLQKRPDLKLIVTSATIDVEAFSRHFNNAPIIEVSGRVYPVDVSYRPPQSEFEEEDDLTYVQAAAREVSEILNSSSDGDILIFMPGERDIRETRDLLEGRYSGEAEIIPLFGRLSSPDQQKVFATLPQRKIVIATNIAETSLTIPGIRYVIDPGLARISHYNPRTRTKRLPIEPISQSSANQRKGRAGRVEAGLCIRLYSEEDFAERVPFTQPEIQRANLAEVILRMKAFHLGQIETFPFLQPPTPAAISAGYSLLQELGALDGNRELTQMGADLARLPIDPTLGRMLLQSQKEHSTHELLVIAAGLSIQDPRDRPMDARDAADAAHKQFNDPASDFLSLLNIWNKVEEVWGKMRAQNQRRKWCRQNFLSYLRIREWQDLFEQLTAALQDLGTLNLNESTAAYDAIHRSILAGLLGHVGQWEERNLYKTTGNRKVSIFPGSVLFQRGEQKKPKASTQPEWIVAGEIVETSQLFARTVAGIEPQWLYAVAPYVCKVNYTNPRWDPKSGRVIADEVALFRGLELQRSRVAYGNINAKEATDIFIKLALIEDENLQLQYQFLAHNHKVRQKIEHWQTRMRRHDLPDPNTALFDFYSSRLENVSSLHELNKFLREPGNAERLLITERDLIGDLALHYDSHAFPEKLQIEGQLVEVQYAYAPGEQHDGVTLKLPFTVAQTVSPALLEWAVPGLREQLILELLRGLPKALRRELMPFPEKAKIIAGEFQPQSKSFFDDLSRFIREKFRIHVPLSAWNAESIPNHLKPRFEVVSPQGKPIAASRNFDEVRQKLEQPQLHPSSDEKWKEAAAKWERFGLRSWSVGDLPERIEVSADPLVYAWPGLEAELGEVNLRLYRTPDQAAKTTQHGLTRLLELELQKDLAWIEKDLRALRNEELLQDSLTHLKSYLFSPLPPLQEHAFKAAAETARKKIPGLAQQLIDQLKPILELRSKLQIRFAPAATSTKRTLSDFSQLATATAPAKPHPLMKELDSILPPHFLLTTPYERLRDLPRYLKALTIRADRAALNPAKDQEKASLLRPYQQALEKLLTKHPENPKVHEFRWMLEEYKVSLFAQELGTAIPVSPKRLDAHLQALKEAGLNF